MKKTVGCWEKIFSTEKTARRISSQTVSNFNIYTCIGDERQCTNILIYTAKVKEERKCTLKKDEPGWMSMPITPVPGGTLGSRPVQLTQHSFILQMHKQHPVYRGLAKDHRGLGAE